MTFKVGYYNNSKLTLLQHWLGFAVNLYTYSELSDINKYMKKESLDLNAELLF